MSTEVLVVDDAADLRLMIRTALHAYAGLDAVLEAGHGLEAIAIAQERRPAAVILDLSMPGMDGIAALVHLRAELPDSGIFVYTASSGRREEAMNAGADGYYLKGIPPKSLVDAITAGLGVN